MAKNAILLHIRRMFSDIRAHNKLSIDIFSHHTKSIFKNIFHKNSSFTTSRWKFSIINGDASPPRCAVCLQLSVRLSYVIVCEFCTRTCTNFRTSISLLDNSSTFLLTVGEYHDHDTLQHKLTHHSHKLYDRFYHTSVILFMTLCKTNVIFFDLFIPHEIIIHILKFIY